MIDGSFFNLKSVVSGVSFSLNGFSQFGLYAGFFKGYFVALGNSFLPDIFGSREIDS